MKVLPLLLALSAAVGASAETGRYPANTDIAAQLGINGVEKYALDGGVFVSAKDGIVIHKTGPVDLLLLKDGVIQSRKIYVDGDAENVEDLVIQIDDQGPVIHTQWHEVLQHDDQVVVGPASRLHWWLDEEEGAQTSVLLNDQKATYEMQQQIQFNAESQYVMIQSVDVFGNASRWASSLQTDFMGPDIQWHLNQPAVFSGETWFAGLTADANLAVHDDAAVQQILVNGEVSASRDLLAAVENNTRIEAKDQLGNVSATVISWQQDQIAPQVYIDGQAVTADNSMEAPIDTVLEVSVADTGLGLVNAEYFSASRRWKPLPKKIKFLNRGYFDVRIRATDKAGNELKKTLKFNVKK